MSARGNRAGLQGLRDRGGQQERDRELRELSGLSLLSAARPRQEGNDRLSSQPED